MSLHAQGVRPLSHRSSQRAEALRQLRELWFSDEAEQPGTPDLPRGIEQPSPLHVAALACNGHAAVNCAPQQSSSTDSSAPKHAAASEANACNGSHHISPDEQRSNASRGTTVEPGAALNEHGSASPVSMGQQKEGNHDKNLRIGSASSVRHKQGASPEPEANSNGDSTACGQPGYETGGSRLPPHGAQGGHPGDSPGTDSPKPQPNGDAAAPQRTQRELHGEVSEPLPLSVGAARSSGDMAAPANASRLHDTLDGGEQLPGHRECSADSAVQAPNQAACQAGEPAWVTGFRQDMRRALRTPFRDPGMQPSRSAERSSAGVSPAAGTANVLFSHDLHKAYVESSQEEELSRMSSPVSTAIKTAGAVSYVYLAVCMLRLLHKRVLHSAMVPRCCSWVHKHLLSCFLNERPPPGFRALSRPL